MSASGEPPQERPWYVRFGPAALLATLLALTALATVVSAQRVDRRESSELTAQAQLAQTAVEQRVLAYTEILRGMAGLLENSRDVTPTEFSRYAQSQRIGERFPGIQGLVYARAVPDADLESYLAQLSREIRGAGLPFVPLQPPSPGSRPLHVITSRAALNNPADPIYGYDLLGQPQRAEVVLRARDVGEPTASAPFDLLLQRETDRRGFLLMVPVYGGADLPPAAADREHAFQGVVYAAFRLRRLLGGILAGLPASADVELYENGRLFYDVRDGRRAEPRNGDETRVTPLDVAGRSWQVVYSRSGSSLSVGERSVPWIIAAGGVLLALMAAALLRALTTGRERAVALATEMTAELRTRETELARSNATLENFAYLASHDLQEPLRTISSYTGLLERRLHGRLEDKESTWLQFVSGAARHASGLIADLLAFSRVGSEPAQKEPVALEDAWDAAVGHLGEAITESGATVQRGALPTVRGNRQQLVSLLQNLIGNAIRYRREGVAPEVRAEALRVDGGWDVRVSDNGIGIDPRYHSRIFALFQRLHTNDEYPGSGMGLAIVRKLAEIHGGTVRVESVPGGGSTFIVTFPVEEQ